MPAARGRSKSGAAWRALDPGWHQAFELAWQGYRVGAVPVGAVVMSSSGAVMSRARDHEYDDDVTGGQGVSRSRLAHAELNALVRLDPYERHEGAVLYTTIEPCALCVGAAVVATVGTVAFASPDPYGGAAGQVPETVQSARLAVAFKGPLPGPVGVLGAVLRLELYLRVNPDAYLVRAHRQLAPDLLAAAEQLYDDDVLPSLVRQHKSMPDVVSATWPVLEATAARLQGDGSSSHRTA